MVASHSPLQRQGSRDSEVSLVVKYLLFALNLLFWIVGGLTLGVGIYAKTEKNLGNLGSKLPWFMDPANLFIIMGSVVFVLAFLGCIGSLRENIAILKTFEYTIDILLLLEVIAVIYVYADRNRVKRNIESMLKNTVINYRDDVDLQSIIDWTQENVKCCGIQGPEDWELNIYFNHSTKASPEAGGVPFSCCKNNMNTQCGYKVRSLSTSERQAVIYTDGCVDSVINYFLNEDNLVLLICVAGAMVLLQLITTGLAHNLVNGIQRQKAQWNRYQSALDTGMQ
ncbi:tetraspanin-17 isoform X2 [Hydra vulgaris]|uniref:Tetraspanin n=1 Tax=Hydra vulgaris TaxID=6087 RepID=A0ABM4D428_HYDVU